MNDVFTKCPGCDNKVKVWPGDRINLCCRPCWQTVWDASYLASFEGREPVEYGHSAQCDRRQEHRRDAPIQVGVYTLVVPDAFDKEVQRLQ